MPSCYASVTRRAAIAAAALLALAPGSVSAQEYPTRLITFVCAFPAGSGADVLVRYFADRVSRVAGQRVIVENRAGANGNIAAEFTARAKPDGYTVFIHAGSSTAANMHLFKNPPIDVLKELRGVQFINKQAFVLAVRADSPFKNVQELTAHLKKKGADTSYATTSTSGKVMGELYKQVAAVQAVEVPYKTGPESLNDLVSGAVEYGILDPVFALSQAREGRLRILAVGSSERMTSMAEIPTMTEQGYPMDQLGWWGVFVPAATPDPVVNKLNALFAEVLKTEETKKFLNGFGGDVYIGTPAEVQALFIETADQWKGFVEMAKIPKN
jgi:tripartite-type tricarboxylate transporter receptor subunit TctC